MIGEYMDSVSKKSMRIVLEGVRGFVSLGGFVLLLSRWHLVIYEVFYSACEAFFRPSFSFSFVLSDNY